MVSTPAVTLLQLIRQKASSAPARIVRVTLSRCHVLNAVGLELANSP
jgi:hypothetical protein